MNDTSEIRARILAAYRAGEYVVGRNAFSACTARWSENDWMNAVTFREPELTGILPDPHTCYRDNQDRCHICGESMSERA